MTTEFKREDRYLVIKRKDIEKLPGYLEEQFSMLVARVAVHIPQRRYVVIESDWPEYETVFKMIEARVTGVPTSEQAEITDLRAALAERDAEIERLRYALEKLACLGNGSIHGNSVGNEIAIAALATTLKSKT